jgi:hypothetical protein
MSLPDEPQAQALLDDAVLSPAAVRGCQEHLTAFLQRYLPLFYRRERRDLATLVLKGRLSGLARETAEPIAHQAGHTRKPVQHFAGAGAWDDEAVTAALRRHVAEGLGDPGGVLVVDSSGFPKKGAASCGVARQWCGRLGKVENCQVGVFPAYAAPGGHAPPDRRPFLPEGWAADPKRRRKAHVPRGVAFQEKWRIALDLLARGGPDVPHGWAAGDDAFGRATAFRAELRHRRERYVLDVPANTLVREAAARPGGKRPPFERAEAWAARQPASRWRTVTVRGGAKGPLKVRALKRRVRTKDEGGHVGPGETLTVLRGPGPEPRTWYTPVHAEQRRPARAAGHPGAGAWRAAPGRGGLAGRQGRGRAGGLRGARLGGPAPPHGPGAGGAAVRGAGAAAAGGEKPRR